MKISFILLICALLSSHIFAQNAEETKQEAATTDAENKTESAIVEVVKLEPSPDASTTFVFPDSADRKFLIGKFIPVVVALTNKGNGVFNVTQVGASFMYPQDHRYYIQNYTKITYGQSVLPSEQRSFLYRFSPDAMLEPREYGLVVSVYYTDSDGGNFTSVVYNSTIALVEGNESIDLQGLFLYIGILGVAGLVGFMVYNAARSSKKKGPRRVEYGTQKSASVIDDEWLQGTSAVQSPKNRVKQQKPKKTN